MSQLKDFDWFLDRLEVARWVSEEPGKRDALTNCPSHGGSDSLHVTEKNGKALVRCFAQQCRYEDIVEALEVGGSVDEPEEKSATQTPARKRRRVSVGKAQPARPRAGKDPRQWLLERCNLVEVEELLDAARLPLSFTQSEVVFEFPEARKLRGVGEGKAGKSYRWEGANAPYLWPMPEDPQEEIVVCEGEMDAIVLRLSGHDAYSVTKGSGAEVPQVIWDALRARGVERVVLAYDLDDAGRKGRAKAAEGVRASGMMALPSRPKMIDVLAGEKDARDVAVRLGLPVDLEDDSDEDDSVILEDVTAAPHEPLLLDRLHPQEHTILFGDGGTGKGVIAAWWVARLTRMGKRVMVVDYEQHAQHEWRPRIERFGGDVSLVRITQPFRPIWDVAGHLRNQVQLHDIDYVVVDSVTYACVGHETESSITAVQYSMAIAMLQVPVLSLAHVTKSDADPNHPFGSAFWSNGARVTIAVSRQSQDDPASPRILRNAKTNQRGPFATVALKWDWLGNVEVGHDDRHCRNHCNDGHVHLDEVPAYRSAADAVRAALAMGATTAEQAIELTGRDDITPESFRTTKSRTKAIKVRRVRRGGAEQSDDPG